MTTHPSDRLDAPRRQALFRAAVEEFASLGFKQASLNRIIAQTGMSKSSFYHYFDSKADLFRCTLDHYTAPYLERLNAFDPAKLNAENFWQALQEAARAQTVIANASSESGVVMRLLQRTIEDPDEQANAAELMQAATQWLTEWIRRGQVLGHVRDDLPEDLLIATVMGFSMSFDSWLMSKWDHLSGTERLTLSDAGADICRRILARPDCMFDPAG